VPSAADPGRNTHRAGLAWSLTTVRANLANPRYTGRQAWNRQRSCQRLIGYQFKADEVPAGMAHATAVT
jgi:hypothetical protein